MIAWHNFDTFTGRMYNRRLVIWDGVWIEKPLSNWDRRMVVMARKPVSNEENR